MQNFKHLDQNEGGNVTQGVWETLKKTFPTNPPTLPAAKINSINGRLVSDEQGLKDLHLETFSHRLRRRPVQPGYEELYSLQQELVRKTLLLTQYNKSPDWTEKQVETVLKSLKSNKAADPLDHINEIYKLFSLIFLKF